MCKVQIEKCKVQIKVCEVQIKVCEVQIKMCEGHIKMFFFFFLLFWLWKLPEFNFWPKLSPTCTESVVRGRAGWRKLGPTLTTLSVQVGESLGQKLNSGSFHNQKSKKKKKTWITEVPYSLLYIKMCEVQIKTSN